MLRALTILTLLSLSACAQLKSSTGGGPPPGTPNQVGKASKADASGFLDMPFLTGLSEEEARETLAQSDMTGEIKIEYTECADKAIPDGHVCNQYPAGGMKTSTTSSSTLFLVRNP